MPTRDPALLAAERMRTLSFRLTPEQAAWVRAHCVGPTTVSVFFRALVERVMRAEQQEVQRLRAALLLQSQPLQPQPPREQPEAIAEQGLQ